MAATPKGKEWVKRLIAAAKRGEKIPARNPTPRRIRKAVKNLVGSVPLSEAGFLDIEHILKNGADVDQVAKIGTRSLEWVKPQLAYFGSSDEVFKYVREASDKGRFDRYLMPRLGSRNVLVADGTAYELATAARVAGKDKYAGFSKLIKEGSFATDIDVVNATWYTCKSGLSPLPTQKMKDWLRNVRKSGKPTSEIALVVRSADDPPLSPELISYCKHPKVGTRILVFPPSPPIEI